MEILEKVELVREKCGVSYEEARDALAACDNDVLDAIVKLEREGKAQAKTAAFATGSEPQGTVSAEMAQAQVEYQRSSKRSKVGEMWNTVRTQLHGLLRAGFDMTFVAERNGQPAITVPLIVMIIGVLAWGATLWLLILGLFFGFRYRIDGASAVTFDVNDAMNKAADLADNIKGDFTKDEGTEE